jgi:hypothetical protein
MKKSDLQEYIRNQIINELSEDQKTQDDIKDTEELIAKTKELEKAKEDAGLAEEVVNEEDIKKRKEAENAIRQTLKDEGGAAGLKPLVKAVKKFGFNKDELVSLLKKIVKVDKHKHGDYILTPINEDEDEPSDADIKKNKSMAKYAEELARTTSDMRTLARDYSKAEGQEKENLLKKLKSKTKLKKELEAILDIKA